MAIKSPVMRNIAATVIEDLLPGLDPATHQEYVTAVVRQWLTNDGHAGVFTVPMNYWLRLAEQGGEIAVGRGESESDLPHALRRRKIAEDELPEVLHQLTIAQSATFVNTDGVKMVVRVVPSLRRFEYEKAEDE